MCLIEVLISAMPVIISSYHLQIISSFLPCWRNFVNDPISLKLKSKWILPGIPHRSCKTKPNPYFLQKSQKLTQPRTQNPERRRKSRRHPELLMQNEAKSLFLQKIQELSQPRTQNIERRR